MKLLENNKRGKTRPPLVRHHTMPAPSNPIHPLESPAYEDVPIWNILPSYQLFQSTFSKNVLPSNEDPQYDPPTYDAASPQGQLVSETGYFPPMETASPPMPMAEMSLEDTFTRWGNTILGNTHKLKQLVDINASVALKLKIDIQLTNGKGLPGARPMVIDPQSIELKQGDSFCGYVTVTNESDKPFAFDMFSVVFEGRISVMGDSPDGKKPLVYYKFLNMFDYNASWTPAVIDPEDSTVDPVDNSLLQFPLEKTFAPGVTYKKYFSFRLPEKLLECACDPHILVDHCEMLPTIGIARDQFLRNLRKLRQRNRTSSPMPTRPKTPEIIKATLRPASPGIPLKRRPMGQQKRIKDFSFPDTAVTYSVEARVVGKYSDYAPLVGSDEYIIVNDSSCFIRCVPKERIPSDVRSQVVEPELQSTYRNLVSRVVQKIDLGKELLDNGGTVLSVALPTLTAIAKSRQLYHQSLSDGDLNDRTPHNDDDFYEIYYPYKKKTLTAPPKIIGLVGITTPREVYRVGYRTPSTFLSNIIHRGDSLVTIPISMLVEFNATAKNQKPSEIKSASAELVCVTWRSRKYPIAITIPNDLIFQNKNTEKDNLETYVIEPFKKHLAELTSLVGKLNTEVLSVDNQLIMDIKSLAELSTKYNTFKAEDVILDQFSVDWTSPGQNKFVKDLEVRVNLASILTKEALSAEDLQYEAFAFVPNFQSCIIGRSYYLKVTLRLHNADPVSIKVPVRIEK